MRFQFNLLVVLLLVVAEHHTAAAAAAVVNDTTSAKPKKSRSILIIPNAKYLRLVLDGKCIEHGKNNFPILDDCRGSIDSSPQQYWEIIRTSIYYGFKNKKSGKCLGRPDFLEPYNKAAEMVDCHLFNRIYWLSDNINNIGLSFWWIINEQKECMKTFANNHNYKRITISKCTNLAHERKMFRFIA